MTRETEALFEATGQALQQSVTAIPCSIEDYIEGLRGLISELETLVEAAEQDLRT